jgi:hypothetical protein
MTAKLEIQCPKHPELRAEFIVAKRDADGKQVLVYKCSDGHYVNIPNGD